MAKAPVVEHDDTGTELESLNELLEQQERRRDKQAAKAPKGFDPAALFLLSMRFDNLFDPVSRNPHAWTCRGCGERVATWDRQKHHGKHRRQVERGELNRKEADVPKGATDEMRRQREERVRRPENVQVAEVTETPEAAPVKAEKPALAAVKAKSRDVAASLGICETLTGLLTDMWPTLAHTTNLATGFRSFKLGGKLIGYAWFTTKPDLRLEWAIQNDDVPAKQRGQVKPYKRSKDIATAGRITGSKSDLAFAVSLFKLAAKKQGAAT